MNRSYYANFGEHRITTKYILEFVSPAVYTDHPTGLNARKRWGRIESGTLDAPWEYYDRREFDDPGEAWTMYFWLLVNPETFDVRPIWEQVFLDGELVREGALEPPGTFLPVLRNTVNREAVRRMEQAERTAEDVERLLEDYRAFIAAINGEKHFEKFCREWRKV